MNIRLDDLTGPEIHLLLEEHLSDMRATSPPESVHALDLAALREQSISFWTLWDQADLLGCAALKELSQDHAEIKSMRTSEAARGRGVASRLLEHMIQIGKQRGYRHLSLETGTMEFFRPARQMYEKHGFEYCAPFSDYALDPHSVFMTKVL